MTPDQLDDAGWSPQQWSALSELARATVERHGRVRRLIPKGPDMLGAYTISVPTYVPIPLPPTYDTALPSEPVLRLRAKFRIRAEQVGDIDLVGRMVVGRARALAAAADDILVNGGAVLGSYGLVDPVFASGLTATTRGLAPVATVPTIPPPGPFDALALAVGILRTQNRVGPFAGILTSAFWNAVVGATAGTNDDGVRRAADLLEADRSLIGLVKDDPAAGPSCVVFEPSATAVDLVTVLAPRVSFAEYNDGDFVLRVEEAFFLRVMDTEAFAKVEFP